MEPAVDETEAAPPLPPTLPPTTPAGRFGFCEPMEVAEAVEDAEERVEEVVEDPGCEPKLGVEAGVVVDEELG